MPFTDTQVQALAGKLSAKHVKTRQANGRTLSYIEGWHVIAEANRIFGFDAWDRQTMAIKCQPSVMEEANIKKLLEPDFTVSLRPSRPPLMIIDKEAIPGDYWKAQPAKLDRQGLISALGNGRDIPGAVLGNPPLTISVRTK